MSRKPIFQLHKPLLTTVIIMTSFLAHAENNSSILKGGVEYSCNVFVQRNYTSATEYEEYEVPATGKPLYSITRKGNKIQAVHLVDPSINVMYDGAVFSKTINHKTGIEEQYTIPGKPKQMEQFVKLAGESYILHSHSDISDYGKFVTMAKCTEQ